VLADEELRHRDGRPRVCHLDPAVPASHSRPMQPRKSSPSTRSNSASRRSGCCRRTSARARFGRSGESGRSRSIRRSTIACFPRARLLGAHAGKRDILHAGTHPKLFCSGKGATAIRRHPDRVPRVLRIDDQHGRAEARPAAPAGVYRVHRRLLSRVERDVQTAAARVIDSVAEKGGMRLRHRDRLAVPDSHHLRDDGHPESHMASSSIRRTSSSASAIPNILPARSTCRRSCSVPAPRSPT